MPIVANPELYQKVKEYADTIYKKSSAFKSMFIQKVYQQNKGTYIDDNKPKNLKRWMKEEWKNIGNKNDYPVLRPTKIIDKKKTPLTVDEIDKQNLKEQIKKKQIIRGNKNLTPFKKKI
jgi:hypothetical protein